MSNFSGVTSHAVDDGEVLALTVPLLDADETEKWAGYARTANEVLGRPIDGDQEGWTSVGSALYLHFWERDRRERIADEAGVVLNMFRPLRQRVAETIESIFLGVSIDTEPPPNVGPPGFHVFASTEQLERCQVHLDTQHLRLATIMDRELRGLVPLTFTVCLAVPEGGGGLEMWNTDNDGVSTMPDDAVMPEPDLVVPYVPGNLMIHWGNRLHAIQAGGSGERISMQGHVAGIDSRGFMYW